MPPAHLPEFFTNKKSRILAELSTPSADYSDKSPKGSIDEPIRDLINLINSYPGWVTTSSCSGRVAVFVEGPKSISDDGDDGNADINELENFYVTKKKTKVVTGGKGGGRWLYVSHTPIPSPLPLEHAPSELFCLPPPSEMPASSLSPSASTAAPSPRLVHLTFSPLILHVLCATLQHAKPLLAAAINAGLRESGVQSLKALDDEEHGVMVGIRTMGVGFSTVVGVASEWSGGESAEERLQHAEVKTLVSEEYLGMCVGVVNEKFEANEERRRRLEGELTRVVEKEGRGEGESKEEKWERKRREGLKRQERQEEENRGGEIEEGVNGWDKDVDDVDIGLLGLV